MFEHPQIARRFDLVNQVIDEVVAGIDEVVAEGDGPLAQLLDLMLRAGSRWVLWLMLGLSLAAIAVIFDRIWFYIQERVPRDRIAAEGKQPQRITRVA